MNTNPPTHRKMNQELRRIHVVIPILNEIENLPSLFRSLQFLDAQLANHFQMHVVLVDDGSADNSADAAIKLQGELTLSVLRHNTNQGPGAAFATAFQFLHSRLKETDLVVTMEGDNTSRHELLRQMLTRMEEGYDVVLASPYMYGGGLSNTTWFRMFLSFVANFFVKETLGLRGLITVSSFYRLYRAPVLQRLQRAYGPRILERTGFESMVELLMKLVFFRSTISEVPMHLDSSVRKGKSKMRIGKTAIGYLTLWSRKAVWISKVVLPNPVVDLKRVSSATELSPLTHHSDLLSPHTLEEKMPLRYR